MIPPPALVAELVDAPDSKSGGGNIVLVRVRPGAPPIQLDWTVPRPGQLAAAVPFFDRRIASGTIQNDQQRLSYQCRSLKFSILQSALE